MKKSKLSIVFVAVACTMAFNSCTKLANQLAQAITWQGVDVSVTISPVSDTALHTNMATGTFSYNLDSFIKAKTGNALGLKNIDTFRFTSCVLSITAGSDSSNNFANFQMAQAAFNTSSNATQVSLGEIDNNPNVAATSLTLPINNTANLRSYLPSSGPVTINYAYGGKLRKATTATLTVNAHIEYYIHVTP